MNTIVNGEPKSYHLDKLGCLQPCPICGKSDYRAPWHNVAHPDCWQANEHKHGELCRLYESLEERRLRGEEGDYDM